MREDSEDILKPRETEVKSPTIKTMMIPLSRCATVREDTTLHDAVAVLYDASGKAMDSSHRSRFLLVFDRENRIVGKVDSLDLIAGVEDGYRKIGDLKSISHMGFTREFMNKMIDSHRLWQDPLSDICRKASRQKVGDIMSKPGPDEFVTEEDSLPEAIHRLAIGHFPFLMVTKNERVTGILRMDDIFTKICDEIRKCEP
jgi:CBS domain-containing protein